MMMMMMVCVVVAEKSKKKYRKKKKNFARVATLKEKKILPFFLLQLSRPSVR